MNNQVGPVRTKCQLSYQVCTATSTGCRINVILRKNDVEQISRNSL